MEVMGMENQEGGHEMPIVRKIGKGDCSGCERENYCYFGVAFKCFPALKKWSLTRKDLLPVGRLIKARRKVIDLTDFGI